MGPHGVPYYYEVALSDNIQTHYAMRITAAVHLHTGKRIKQKPPQRIFSEITVRTDSKTRPLW